MYKDSGTKIGLLFVMNNGLEFMGNQKQDHGVIIVQYYCSIL